MTYEEMTDEQRIAEFAKVGVKIGSKIILATGAIGIVTDIDYEGAWLYYEGKYVTKLHPWSFSGINCATIAK